MKLYLLTQDYVDGYDTYDSSVVCAESEEDARNIHPSPLVTHVKNNKWMGTFSDRAINGRAGEEYENDADCWPKYADIDKIEVEYLGETSKGRGVILASFNAV